MPKTDKQILDEALAEQAKGTYVDPLVEAKRTLQRANDLARMTEIETQNRGNSIRPLTGAEKFRHGIDSVLDKLQLFKKPHEAVDPNAHSLAEGIGAAALPAAMYSNPVGAAAGAALGLQGLYAATDPRASLPEKAMSVAGAGMGLGQAARAARMPFKVLGVGDEIAAQAAAKAPRRFTLDDVVTNEKLAGSLDEQPARNHVFDMTGNGARAPQRNSGRFDVRDAEYDALHSGKLTGNKAQTMEDAAEDAMFATATPDEEMLAARGELADIDANVSRLKPRGGRDMSSIRGFTQNGLDDTLSGLQASPLEVVDEAQGAAQSMPGPGDVPSLQGLMAVLDETVPTGRSVLDRAAQQAARAKRSGPLVKERLNRLTEADVKEFQRQQQHGMAGFQGLPELPQSELARISAAIARITGK